MPLFTLGYVYQLSDFDTTGGNITPPDEQGARAQGNPPFQITLNNGASPLQIVIDDDDPLFNETSGTDSSQPLASPVTIDGVTYPAGSHVVLNYVLTDDDGFQGYSITIGSNNSGGNTTTAFITTEPMVPGQTYTFTSEGNIGNNNAVPYSEFACFTAGTLIDTLTGARRIETLQVGDLVMTEGGARPLSWIGMRQTDGRGHMAPIRISKGTLGAEADVLVSPNHRILVQGAAAELVGGTDALFVAAKHLVNGTTICHAPCLSVRYLHIMFRRHEVVRTQGLASESFYLDRQSIAALDSDQAQELAMLFPERFGAVAPALAYPEAKRHEAKLLARTLAA